MYCFLQAVKFGCSVTLFRNRITENKKMSVKVSIIIAASEVEFEAARDLCRDWVKWQVKVFPGRKDIILKVFEPVEYANTLKNLSTIHARPKGAILLATLNKKYVGCVMYHELIPTTAEIKRLFVRESARGHGVGHLLLTEMFKCMKNDGYERTQFNSARFLTHARHLYEKVGFQEIPLPKGTPKGMAKTSYFMERNLNAKKNQAGGLTDRNVWGGMFGQGN